MPTTQDPAIPPVYSQPVPTETLSWESLPFRLKGRLGRFPYMWLSALCYAGAYFGGIMITPSQIAGRVVYLQPGWLMFVGFVLMLWMSWFVIGPLMVMRLHDINMGGAWALSLVAIIFGVMFLMLTEAVTIESGSGIMNGVTVFCWLALSAIPGTDGPNRFGATRYRIIE